MNRELVVGIVAVSLAVLLLAIAGVGAAGRFYDDSVRRFATHKYGAHTYVAYDGVKSIGMVHDPDCRCKQVEAK